MFDCGEGTQTQLMKSALKAGKITRIFITHLHGDHLYGISGLLCTISQSNQRDEPVSIYGPLGLAKYMRVTLGLARSELGFRFKVIELIPTEDMYKAACELHCNISSTDEPALHPCEDPGMTIESETIDGCTRWPLIQDGPLQVVAGKLDHRIPSFAFIIKEQNIPGSFDIAKLKSLGLEPGPVCKKLSDGEIVTSPSGISVTLKDVIDAERPGRKVVICGDSSDSFNISKIAHEADVYIHETTLENGMKELAIERGHSTPQMAAEFAMRAEAKWLYITHFSQRYTESSSKTEQDKTIQDLLAEAKETFGPNCEAAEDLRTFPILPRKRR